MHFFLKIRIAAGKLYVSTLARLSTLIQRWIPKHGPAGKLLARVKHAMWRGPVARQGVLLDALSRLRPEVRFVQIGANDGVLHDPLRPYILKYRWRGVLVEPMPDIFERLKANYATCDRLAFENVAIAAAAGDQRFYYVAAPADSSAQLPSWHAGLGSLSREVVLKHAGAFPDIVRHLASRTVRCDTFEAVCQRHGMQDLDLIAIDAEGHDFELLAQIDLTRYRPVLLIYEHHHMTVSQAAACRQRLASYGYEFIEEFLDTICLRSGSLEARDKPLQRVWNELRGLAWLPL